MTEEDFTIHHLRLYFFSLFTGCFFVWAGHKDPIINKAGEMVAEHNLFFIIFGAVLILLSFIGFLFYSVSEPPEDKEKK